MNHNLLAPWKDGCSQPQSPYLTFYSPQSAQMLFTADAQIEIICQAGLRALALRWTLHRNMLQAPFRTGTAEALPANRFRITLDTTGLLPGFYDLRVVLDTGVDNAEQTPLERRPVRGLCTFGWQADEMAFADTRPADFAAFWQTAKATLSDMALDAREAPLERFGPEAINAYNVTSACLPPDYDPAGHRTETVESGKVDFAGPGGRLYGWLAKPIGDGPFPAMLVLPGAGINARPRPLEHARHGYVALDLQLHGQDVDLETYPQLPGYYDGHVYDPPTAFYYYLVHLRCVQAVSYLASRSDVDPTRIVVVGGSQGGRLTVVTAGLDPRVAAGVAAIPHFGHQAYLHWAETASDDGMAVTGPPPVVDTPTDRGLAYYDPLNFAPDVRCPMLCNVGLIDHVSPPSSVWPVYQRLGSAVKEIVPLDGLGHDWSAEFDRYAWRWLDDVLAR
jgi:cephalosporin-C deacetylase-like acetyl esterase